ncbi:MAG: hypothetical protein HY735_04765 [Verrucomicrobia bacterium]|nr:hypothetical protein [Verrucomicrobiota bacterium]
MPHGPQKLILIRAGRYDYAEVELSGTLQIVGPNNTGKTTLINTLQFLYLDDRRHMDFGSYTPEQTRDYYFPNQYSYILFQCLGARGQCVLGWRGQSKAAGGEPERFSYEGPFDPADFLDEMNQVREPKDVKARLSARQFTVLKSAQDHRELLLLPTKGESRGLGLVALRDNDKYPQFRETLKNLLCLSTITQDQMRDRLLMLAGLPVDKYALDVRELFGEDYDRILRLKHKLLRFKKHQGQVEHLVDLCARRDGLRGELLYRWSDLRAKRQAFEQEHTAKAASLRAEAQAAAQRIQILTAEIADRRADERSLSESKGSLTTRLNQIAVQEKAFGDFVEDLERTALKNVEAEIRRLERQLADAEKETRDKAEIKLKVYREVVEQKRRTLAHFDRALVTVLRRDLTDDELAPLAKFFNFSLLEQPVGEDGIRLIRREEFVRLLRALGQRIQKDVYRDANVELPLPASDHSLAELANPDAVRERLAEDEATLQRWQEILQAIHEREKLGAELQRLRAEETRLRQAIFGWEKLQQDRAALPRLTTELKQTEEALVSVAARIGKLEKEIEGTRDAKDKAERATIAEENQFNAVMGRFNSCVFPEYDAKPLPPDETIPNDFDAAVAVFLRQQGQLDKLDHSVRETFMSVEAALGSDYAGADENETVRLLREELEALPEQEDALRRDWEHQLHQLRATFDQVLRALGDIKSAADRLNRELGRIQVSNIAALRMEVVEQADLVGSLRKLANVEQPGLFDDSSSLEAALGGFRQKFEANPLLRYSDLFTLRFTVTGEDGKPHHYHDFRQVESHGTTITIKVLFNLLVLRSLLREDSTKSLLCEVPFFLDEIHSLDPTNRHAVLSTARKLGFIAITAAPESVSEVNALYFLQPRKGRIVLRRRHRIGVKAALKP